MLLLILSPDIRYMRVAALVFLGCASLALLPLLRRASGQGVFARLLRLGALSAPALAFAAGLGLGMEPAPKVGWTLTFALASVPILLLVALVATRAASNGDSDDPFDWLDPLGNAPVWPLALLLVPLTLSMGAPRVPASIPVENPRSVILIAVDTLRWDSSLAMEGRGRERVLMPRVRDWAGQGTIFDTAISQAPWTMPAFASVLTGRYPREHRAISLMGRLSLSEITLAELLREAGYWNAAVVSHGFVDRSHGFAQGFDRFDEANALGPEAITSANVSDTAIRFLEQRASDPFFLYVHYFDPHYNYLDQPDWNYASGYDGWLRDRPFDIHELRKNRQLLREVDLRFLQDLYDEEVAFTDREIGRLLDSARDQGILDDAVVVFVADHGEEFMEHGWIGHTVHLHDELVRVPLAIRLPDIGNPVPVVAEPVETRAIFATLLQELGIAAVLPGSSNLAGRTLYDPAESLAPLMRGEVSQSRMPKEVYSEVWLPDAPRGSGKRIRSSSVRTSDWKLVRDHTRGFEALYDLSADPGETTNAAKWHPEKRSELATRLESWLQRMDREGSVTPTSELSHQERERLRALGYLD
jgi:arylsulfatase A-like enzyme